MESASSDIDGWTTTGATVRVEGRAQRKKLSKERIWSAGAADSTDHTHVQRESSICNAQRQAGAQAATDKRTAAAEHAQRQAIEKQSTTRGNQTSSGGLCMTDGDRRDY